MGRPKGSRNRSTADKAAAVKTLTDAGLPVRRVAEQLGMARETVRAIRDQIADYMAAEAPTVTEDWRKAVMVAAGKGKHEPMKDWLLHAGVIQPLAQDKPTGPQILIGIASLPGLPSVAVDSNSHAEVSSPSPIVVVENTKEKGCV